MNGEKWGERGPLHAVRCSILCSADVNHDQPYTSFPLAFTCFSLIRLAFERFNTFFFTHFFFFCNSFYIFSFTAVLTCARYFSIFQSFAVSALPLARAFGFRPYSAVSRSASGSHSRERVEAAGVNTHFADPRLDCPGAAGRSARGGALTYRRARARTLLDPIQRSIAWRCSFQHAPGRFCFSFFFPWRFFLSFLLSVSSLYPR